jgi:hypothetical protein
MAKRRSQQRRAGSGLLGTGVGWLTVAGWLTVTSVAPAGLGYGLGRFVAPDAPLAAPGGPPGSAADSADVDRGPAGLGAVTLIHPSVSSWRRDLRKVPRRVLDAYLARPDRWRDQLVPILASHEVPSEFLYLALVESGMDPDAESPAAAVGLWQFTPATARQYGLIVGDGLDERLDWRRSTTAAGMYLSDLYDLFGTWELAAAAYNAGPGRVSRALAETGTESYWELVEAGRLPEETREYVPKFLAIVQLAGLRDGGVRADPASLEPIAGE